MTIEAGILVADRKLVVLGNRVLNDVHDNVDRTPASGEKLAEEEAERKVKGETKKEKHLVGEKGHVKPLNYLDAHEKFLISVATKGVFNLFNTANKAQNAQKGLHPLRSKDAELIKKRKKEAPSPPLEVGNTPVVGLRLKFMHLLVKGPSLAPLGDNYMLTNSKAKDWDEMPDNVVAD